MQRNLDRSSKLTGVNSEHVDLSTRGSNEQIVFAGMEIESCHFSLTDYELSEGLDTYFVIAHLN
jgi:hypothetical protein